MDGENRVRHVYNSRMSNCPSMTIVALSRSMLFIPLALDTFGGWLVGFGCTGEAGQTSRKLLGFQ